MLCSSFYKDCLVCDLSIDSTIVECRRKPAAREKKKGVGHRGRKRNGSEEQKAVAEEDHREEGLHELKVHGDIQEYLDTLCGDCSLTGKRNPKGHMRWSIGYKVHLAVDDFGIPVASVVTSACVYDAKVAIPLVRIAGGRCVFLYALMDGVYSDKRIAQYLESIGKIPVIDSRLSGTA